MAEILGVKTTDLCDEVQQSFLRYSADVIRNRAIPELKDGLKPVHRRILWTMHEMGCKANSGTKKCARIVGSTMGMYHPHGDMAIYDALVRMAQPFSLSLPLIKSQGNFGSVDDSTPASSRYTECKLSEFGEFVLFSDIDYDTVDMMDNYTGEFREPSVLPARVPLILLTASSGIAVGMATTIFPHNLTEVCNGLIAALEDKNITLEKLAKYIPAPDFPLGGVIKNGDELLNMYKSGNGSFEYRAAASFETEGKAKAIIIRSVPYGVSKSKLIADLAAVVREDKIEGISEVRDESTKNDGIRICVELKNNANHEGVLGLIYQHTGFAEKCSQNIVVISNQKPQVINLLDILTNFIDFRREIIKRRTTSMKKKNEHRKLMLDAVLIALKNSEQFLNIVKTHKEPLKKLGEQYKLSQEQAEYIYRMPVSRFSRTEANEIEAEQKQLAESIKEQETILAKKEKIDAIIKKETEEVRDRFGYERKTSIVADFTQLAVKDSIKEQDVAVVVMSDGTIKTMPVADYRIQKRRNQELQALKIPDGVYPMLVEISNNHADLMVFTDKGNRYKFNIFDVCNANSKGKPKHISTYVPAFVQDEKIVGIMKATLADDECLVVLSAEAMLKKQSAAAVNGARDNTTLFYPVDKGGKVVSAILTKATDEILVSTVNGQVLRTSLTDIREVESRLASGVAIMKLSDGDSFLNLSVVKPNGFILTVTTDGYIKRMPLDEFVAKGRGGIGVRTIKEGSNLCFCKGIGQTDEDSGVFILTNTNKAIRIRHVDVTDMGRNTTGKRIVRMVDGETIAAISEE
jgi:DNA gyrase subunit A